MSVVSDLQESQQLTPVAQYDVIVVGAGPYGLTTAAHLLAKGLNVAVFGKPMELWARHMPPGMYLRSHWWATSLSDPQKKYTFARYLKMKNINNPYPVPIQLFLDYALWFQRNAVPNVDETYVTSVKRQNERFIVTLEDGRVVQATSVVMAIGVYYFGRWPQEFRGFSKDLVSHAFDNGDFSGFEGKKIMVVGGGQSAVEYSALLLEEGKAADVHLVVRRAINWLPRDRHNERTLWEKIQAPSAGIAPGWENWVLEYIPYLFYRFAQDRKDRFISSNYQAAASHWLRERVLGEGKVKVHEHTTIKELTERDGKLDVSLSDGQQVQIDHLLLSTGYEVKMKNLSMIDPSLLVQIKEDQQIPVLSHWFESSVPGLFFIGLSSVRAFGPLYRFVVGAKAAGKRAAAGAARYVAQHK
ncbi:NAD(P)-binding domain-containing protein [Dictyobacter aurantiacus]|uniref:FAD/NAD(P)-binding domain-containing protein n=1 Tax=Dictyobacter aurantiacus TaxID=1936993 RepID=A0A401ZA95_9CHLR|nr:NAD(P)-binding domain-containing protein [Dictyobacter aurantiacus]GCE03718.1 hypothetical protein KDAU_10470 [Dictyobacter aurantiacus]